MRLYEITGSPTLYHGSRTSFKPGDMLTAQNEGYVAGSGLDPIERAAHVKIEAFLERFKPPGAVSRIGAVFMCSDPEDIDYAGGYVDHIYVVKPQGPVTRCNLHWYSEINSYAFEDGDLPTECEELARRYWSATPSGPNDLYEFLTTSAIIVQEID